MKNNQQGYVGTVLMLAAAAIGTVTVVTQQKQQSINQQLDVFEDRREREQIKIAALNTAARYKALLSERKDPATGVYRPGIYAADYFSDNWQIKDNTRLKSPDFTFNSHSGTVIIASAAKSKKELDRANAVFNDASATSQFGENFNLRIVDTTRATSGPGAGLIVESVDVEISMLFNKENGRRDEKMRVRVPVPVPKPYDPEILYRIAGSGSSFQPLTSGSQLTGAHYEFKTRASGIFVGTNLYIDGVRHKMGYRSYNDIYHDGRSYDAQDVVMPETVLADFQDTTWLEKNSDSTCVVRQIDGKHTVKLEVIGVDGEIISTPTIVMHTDNKQHPLSLKDYENKCVAPDECPYVGGEPGPDGRYDGGAIDYYWKILNGGGKIPHVSAAWTHQEAAVYNLHDKKLCVHLDPKKLDPNDPTYMEKAKFVTYSVPACEAQFLGTRDGCGCVAEDTLITLGDGKTQKRIDQLQQSDTIWNPILKKPMSMRKLTRGPEAVPMLDISVDGKSLKVTGNHPFPTRDGMKTAFKLIDGEEIQIDGGKWVKIGKIAAVPAGREAPVVWNIEIDAPNDNWDAHHYVANGVVTGDLLIQMEMEKAQAQAAR